VNPSGDSLDPVICESVTRLGRLRDSFVAQLHADIAPLLPDVTEDGWPLCNRIVDALLWIPGADQPAQAIASSLQWVGAQNRMEGFNEDRYLDMGRALVGTIRTLVGTRWFTTLGSAWIRYFMSVRPYLVAGAQQAAQDPAVQEADRARFLARQSLIRQQQIASGDVDLESVAKVLEDEDDDEEDAGYSQIMATMTLTDSRRENPSRSHGSGRARPRPQGPDPMTAT
jgi:hypothetical protein